MIFSGVALLQDQKCLDTVWFILSIVLGFANLSSAVEDSVSQQN